MDKSAAQIKAQEDFSQLSFFILTGLEEGAEFGYDSKLFVVKAFTGVKLLPSGLHLFVFSASPSSTDTPEIISGGVGVRHGFLRFFGEGETVVEEWDNSREQLKSSDEGKPTKRRRVTKGKESTAAETVISEDYLKGLDKTLAPYSKEVADEWTPLSNFITEGTLLRVVGLDERGNAQVDAVMGSTTDNDELKAAVGKRTWGKEREPEEEEDAPQVELLGFVAVDVKRSWPPGAVGEDLTKWSKDKSWLLSKVVKSHLDGDVKELLAEIQLSFVLFTLVHNFSSLSAYKSFFSLLCRSPTLLLPTASRSATSPHTSSLLTDSAPPLYASFLSLFISQLAFLSPDFFSNHMPGLDLFLLAELEILHAALSDATSHWSRIESPSREVWKTLIGRWDAMCAVAMERFGWQLEMVKGSRMVPQVQKIVKQMEEEGYVDIEDLEEGEDAPVIVEM